MPIGRHRGAKTMAIERNKIGKPLPQPSRSADEECVSDARRDSAEQEFETQTATARRIAEMRRRVLRELGREASERVPSPLVGEG